MADGAPAHDSYDVVIVGGAVMGSSAAWFLSADPAFDGRVLVVERDPTYADSSTARTNSCIRQQFTNPLNVEISRFGAQFIHSFAQQLEDPDLPDIELRSFGYMYLAGDEHAAEQLRASQRVQAAQGAATRILGPDQIAAEYPFYEVGDIVCGSINLVDEGWFDSGAMFDGWRRAARRNGVEFHTGEVVAMQRSGHRVTGIELAGGSSVSCGVVVNASGPRAARTAAMAGLDLPVLPFKRYSFVFDAAEPLDRDLPLTIDPSGVHVRSDGGAYLAGCTPDVDPPVDPTDLRMDNDIWEDKVWPVLAHRIPAFERIRVTSRWAGHYSVHTLDHNAVVGRHPEVANFVFMNGFSGHGMQQSPAMGRGVAELIAHGGFRTLDLSPLGYERVVTGTPFAEGAII